MQFHCIGCLKIDRYTGIWEAVLDMKMKSEDVLAADKDEWTQKWVRETDALSEKLRKESVDARLSRDLLKDDRR